MSSTEQLFRDLADAFETAKRPDGSRYVTIKDGCAEWIPANLSRLIHEAVDGSDPRMPDDWIYAAASEMADGLAEHAGDDLDDIHDSVHELADGAVDIVNADLLEWAKHGANQALIDEARDEYGPPRDWMHGIQMGQFRAYECIAQALVDVVREALSEAETES